MVSGRFHVSLFLSVTIMDYYMELCRLLLWTIKLFHQLGFCHAFWRAKNVFILYTGPFIWSFLLGTVHFYSPVRAADVAKEEAAVLHQWCHIWERQQVLVQSHSGKSGQPGPVPCPLQKLCWQFGAFLIPVPCSHGEWGKNPFRLLLQIICYPFHGTVRIYGLTHVWNDALGFSFYNKAKENPDSWGAI